MERPHHGIDAIRCFFKGQTAHLLLLIVLLVAACRLVDVDRLAERRLFAVGSHIWFLIALSIPIVHQVYVWLAWRSELCFGSLTRRFGSHAFRIYRTVFMALLLSRPLSILLLATADHDSIELSYLVRVPICLMLVLPAGYTLYCVIRYFGLSRAAGIDHFDDRYRSKPLVRKGIFKYTSHSMYTFGFLILWAIAVAGASWAAGVASAFSHAYIWVHYFCTERPDMRSIYGARDARP